MTNRIAMWSGPRNISTAMMRSFENRPDTQVIDEPFYAYYLTRTGSNHPGFDDILASQSSQYSDVIKQLTEQKFDCEYLYQKLMTHHMFADDDLDWTGALTHCFLIRHPASVVVSYTKRRGQCSAEDIGIHQQVELYKKLTKISGQNIPVFDSDGILSDPHNMLPKLCDALDMPFTNAMLNWPSGPRESDGVWAKHWYANVNQSSGFSTQITSTPQLNSDQQRVVDQVMGDYLWLKSKVWG